MDAESWIIQLFDVTDERSQAAIAALLRSKGVVVDTSGEDPYLRLTARCKDQKQAEMAFAQVMSIDPSAFLLWQSGLGAEPNLSRAAA